MPELKGIPTRSDQFGNEICDRARRPTRRVARTVRAGTVHRTRQREPLQALALIWRFERAEDTATATMMKLCISNKILKHRAAVCACGWLLTGTALAGTAPAPSIAQLGQVLVEAQQPLAPGLKTHAPAKVLTATTLHNLGIENLGQALRLVPIFGSSNGLGTGRTNKFTNGGEQSADLFDLTNSRVVILVNGQRWIQGFQGDTDLSTVPVSLIQRIDVYPARGSVAYGNGAIAGVVNIITVHGFNGVMASAGTGISQGSAHWDGRRSWASVTLGHQWTSSGLMAVLSWSDQSPVSAADRSLTAGPLRGTGLTRESTITPYGRFQFVPTSGPYATSTLCPVQSDGARLCDLTASGGPGGGYRPIGSADTFNTFPYYNLIMPLKQMGLFVSGFHHFGNGITAKASIFVGRRTASQVGPPSTLTLGTSGLPISVSANQPFNPFGVALEATGSNPNLLALSVRTSELGPVVFNDVSDTLRASFSLNGHIDPQSHTPWTWKIAYLFSSSRVNDHNRGRINLSNLALALASPSVCASIPTCSAVNLFTGPSGMSAQMSAFISLAEQNHIANSLQTLTVTISQERLAELPAGPVAFDLGYQHLARHGDFAPDSAASQGIDSAAPLLSVPSYIGGYGGNAIWSQMIVPLIGAHHPVTLGTGVRVYDYSDTGLGHVADVTLNFRPTRQLSLQAGWTEGFRNPNLRELGQAMPGAATTVSDPCSNYTAAGVDPAVAAACAASGVPRTYVQTNSQTQVLKTGNPALQPERSENTWLSARWTPRDVPRLSVDISYYRISIRNAILRRSAQQTLTDCYQIDNTAECAGIHRAPSGQLTVISTPTLNGQRILTSWLTGGLRYGWRSPIGAFAIRTDIAWVRRYSVTTPTATGVRVENLAGVELGSGSPSGIPSWTGTATVAWNRGSWNAGWQLDAIGPMSEACSDRYDGTSSSYTALGLCSEPNLSNPNLSRNRLGTTIYHDVYLGYRFSKKLSLTAGIDNVLGTEPPVSVLQTLHYDPSIYPAPGRTVYARVKLKM